MLKFFLALWCASVGALFTFPGIRLSRMQWEVGALTMKSLNRNLSNPFLFQVIQYSEGNNLVNVALHASFVAPLLISTLWVNPLSRDYLTERTFKGMERPMSVKH